MDFKVNLVNSSTITIESVKCINNFFAGKIICLPTENLISNIADNYHKYSETMNFQRMSKVMAGERLNNLMIKKYVKHISPKIS